MWDFRGNVSALYLVRYVGKLLVITELYRWLELCGCTIGITSKRVCYFAAKCLVKRYVCYQHFCTIRYAKDFFYNKTAESFNIKNFIAYFYQ